LVQGNGPIPVDLARKAADRTMFTTDCSDLVQVLGDQQEVNLALVRGGIRGM
jgi:hypothetical protein